MQSFSRRTYSRHGPFLSHFVYYSATHVGNLHFAKIIIFALFYFIPHSTPSIYVTLFSPFVYKTLSTRTILAQCIYVYIYSKKFCLYTNITSCCSTHTAVHHSFEQVYRRFERKPYKRETYY